MTDTQRSAERRLDPDEALALARFAADGLLPAVVQEASTQQVLMVGYMDREALRRTLTEGRVVFWSRSRQEYWRKGDTSGHIQLVRGAALDCDADALLVTVEQVGPACHTGAHACFDTHPISAATNEIRADESRTGESRTNEPRTNEQSTGAHP